MLAITLANDFIGRPHADLRSENIPTLNRDLMHCSALSGLIILDKNRFPHIAVTFIVPAGPDRSLRPFQLGLSFDGFKSYRLPLIGSNWCSLGGEILPGATGI